MFSDPFFLFLVFVSILNKLLLSNTTETSYILNAEYYPLMRE